MTNPMHSLHISRRKVNSLSTSRPPSRLLRIDPDKLIGLFDRGAQAGLEALGREVVLFKVGSVPALLSPVVIEPEPEAGGDHALIGGSVGGQGRGVVLDRLVGLN